MMAVLDANTLVKVREYILVQNAKVLHIRVQLPILNASTDMSLYANRHPANVQLSCMKQKNASADSVNRTTDLRNQISESLQTFGQIISMQKSRLWMLP